MVLQDEHAQRSAQAPHQPTLLYGIGQAAARHRRPVIGLWLVAVVAALATLPGLVRDLDTPSLQVAGSPADRAAAALQRGFPELGAEQMLLVFGSDKLAADDPAYLAAAQAGIDTWAKLAGTGAVEMLPPAAGQDARHLYAVAGLTGTERDRQARLPEQRAALQQAVHQASTGRVRVSPVGESSFFSEVKQADLHDLRHAETVAVPVALAVLVAGLGAVGAGLLPLLMAGVSIAVTCGVLAAIAAMAGARADSLTLTVAATIGLGLGLDYALLLVVRHRQSGQSGDPRASAGMIVDTAGRTVLWCGLAVVVTATALLTVRAQIVWSMALPVIVAALVAPLVALTLLPALMAAVPAVFRSPPRREKQRRTDGVRWARHLMRHPALYAIAAGGFLLLLAAPATGLRLGMDYDRASMAGTDPGRGIAQMERDGIASMLVVALPHPPGEPVEVSALVAALQNDERVSVALPRDNGRDLTAVLVAARHAADRPQTEALVRDLRASAAGYRHVLSPSQDVLVAGMAGDLADLKQESLARLGQVALLVLGCSLVFLVAALRSVLLPVKAVTMNVLAVGAAFGLLTLVSDHEVNALLPLLTFTLVFGLSMDYEVFLVHRIAEHCRATGDNTEAVARGLRDTARPITLAAAVLVVTFASLMTAGRQELRQFGFVVAAAIALDATLIRLVLVPALMRLLGGFNWWLPRPLHRWAHCHGPTRSEESASVDTPRRSSTA